MKNKAYFIVLLYLLFAVSGSVYGIGERTIQLSGDSLWRMADYRTGITEATRVRSATVLVLSSSAADNAGSAGAHGFDAFLSFDEGTPASFRDSAGNYRLSASPALSAVDRRYARAGSGAALFPGSSPAGSEMISNRNPGNSAVSGPLVLEPQRNSALFAPNNRFRDFSVEFWLHPLNMGNGEEILQWSSTRSNGRTHFSPQKILCVSSRNRLQWSFSGFFVSPDGANSIDVSISGTSTVVPRTWSHHLIRFDSNTGLIEYLVNGRSEAIVYATTTGREGGEIYTPATGEGGRFILGGNYMGMMDEFRIYNIYFSSPSLQRYPMRGGRLETRAIDLGEGNNNVLQIEASGGRTSILNARVSSEYRQSGRFRFSDESEMQFFIRASGNPYRWDSPWQAVTPGVTIGSSVSGRYVQVAVDFYPSHNGESSPFLEELRIVYAPDEPPLPPANLTAVAMDGAVRLQWRNSPNQNTQGYLVYYGTSSDNYFGDGAVLGASPIDAGMQNVIVIDGLRNGVLYFFRVAAYSHRSIGTAGSFHAGEFSREVRARPLQDIAGN